MERVVVESRRAEDLGLSTTGKTGPRHEPVAYRSGTEIAKDLSRERRALGGTSIPVSVMLLWHSLTITPAWPTICGRDATANSAEYSLGVQST